ncbi:MAG TPA: C-type lectin domain-containing protein [Polyangiaceae bacterium]|nr:C-type lectin domain-containing protein [Polyangiaceae bacterium]
MSGRVARRAGWLVAWAAFLGAAGCQVLFGVDVGALGPQDEGGAGSAGATAGMGSTPQQGAGGSTAASGAGGTNGTGGGPGGQGGVGGILGPGGQGGAGGSSGAGGQPSATCDASKGEFGKASAPGSCFFILTEGSKAMPPGNSRTEWNWDEARDDCNALSSQLASLASGAEFDELRSYLFDGGGDLGVDSDVWIGARTDAPVPATPQELAYLFTWQSGEPWTYHTFGGWSWPDGEPALNPNDLERCVEMRHQFAFEMNNRTCEERLRFVLCERDTTVARGR